MIRGIFSKDKLVQEEKLAEEAINLVKGKASH